LDAIFILANNSFASRLVLTLKAMSMTRGQLASALSVDKSLVGRWASGKVMPSAHNLSLLTQFFARSFPGFSLLVWDYEAPAFAAVIGVGAPEPAQSLSLPLAMPLPSGAVTASIRAYEGIWRITTSAGLADQPDLFLHGYTILRMHPDGYLSSKAGMFDLLVDGWTMLVGQQLFSAFNDQVSGRVHFTIMNGVIGGKPGLMDGIGLSCRGELGGVIVSWALVTERVADLTDDPAADLARFMSFVELSPVAEPQSVPERVRHHLVRDVGPRAAAAGGDLLLYMRALDSMARAAV
jgi:transcriptional regulator with XRE-family HTH domain